MNDKPNGNFDPLAPETLADPHAAYAELRGRCPVAHSDRWNGFWMLTRFAEVKAVSMDARTYINSVQNVVPKVTTSGRRPPLHFDPPEQTRYRKILSGPFSAATANALEPELRQTCIRTLQPFIAAGGGDLTAAFAGVYPVLALCIFLNAPASVTPEQISTLSETFLKAFHSRDHAGLEAASRQLYALAKAILDARRETPLDPERDVASALLVGRIDGEPIPEEMLQGVIRQLLVAGHLAVTLTIGSCVRHLALYPDLQAELRAKPELIPEAIDELLRLYTPNQGFARTARHPVEIAGVAIEPKEPIVLHYPSANRDETVFEDPDTFKWGRKERHIAFGNGPHKCLGEKLARLELKVALEEVLARTTSFEMAGEPEYAVWPEYGPTSLPLRLRPAAD